MTESAGVLPVDKPAGPTSHDVVAMARKALATRRVGHAGTLDPFASGLLLLCIGEATRLAEFLTGLDKTYLATLRLGEGTDTDDRTGTVIARSDAWRTLTRERVAAALDAQVGERLQVPPAYSAKKIEGERAYRLARRGETAAPAPSPVRIDALRALRIEPPDVDFEITCGSGTYVRAVARDIGLDLECYGHLRELRRTRIGRFRVEDAIGLDQLPEASARQAAWIEPAEAVGHVARVELDEAAAARFRHGASVPAGAVTPGADPGAGETVAVLHAGRLIGIGELDGDSVRPRKVFAG